MSMARVALTPVREEYMNFPGYFSDWHRPGLNESILIYLVIGGSVIPMHVSESDSIASVKLRIQTFKGFFVKQQKLVYEGRELARDNSHVRDYGVSDGNVLHLVLRLSDMQAISVRTVCGKEFDFHVERNRNVGYLKQQISQKGRHFVDLKEQELICDGEELDDHKLIHDICKNDDAVVHLLVRKSAKIRSKPVEKDIELSIMASNVNEKGANVVNIREKLFQTQSKEVKVVKVRTLHEDFVLVPIIVSPDIVLPPVITDLILSTFDGLKKGHGPIRSSEGSGGTYFMRDSSGQKYVSVFKPVDEEPMAVNNPRGLPLSMDGEGLKKGTRVGEGALREVAAYILDHPKGGPRSLYGEEIGFAGVPPTFMVKCLHQGFNHPRGYNHDMKNVKFGSLQMFVKNCGSCEDMGPRAFPIKEVHKISVLDIRLANTDRHAGNILLSKDDEGGVVLTPIDHGYCLPQKFEDCTFDWLYWPQARQPYTTDIINYIKSLDAERDIELLKFHGWELPAESARVFRISTMLLKKGVERGLCPFAIGSVMCRETLKTESVIEQVVLEAAEAVLPGTSEAAFMESVSTILDRRLDDLCFFS